MTLGRLAGIPEQVRGVERRNDFKTFDGVPPATFFRNAFLKIARERVQSRTPQGHNNLWFDHCQLRTQVRQTESKLAWGWCAAAITRRGSLGATS